MPLIVTASDLDDLKAVDQAGRKLAFSLNSKDTAAYLRLFHKDYVSFSPEAAFPTMPTKDEIRQAREATNATTDSLSFTDNYADYRVVGNTGIVSLLGTMVSKPKDGPAVTQNVRWTLVYVKTGGNWLLVTTHGSFLP